MRIVICMFKRIVDNETCEQSVSTPNMRVATSVTVTTGGDGSTTKKEKELSYSTHLDKYG